MPPTTSFPQGFLICFEGIDGAGKTTQVRRLAAALQARGLDVVITKEPTDGPHGARIRASAQSGRMDPREELHVLIADRRDHVRNVILPSLAAGKVVILDRYFWSTMAYQGATLGNPQGILAANLAFAPLPDLTLFLDVPVEVSQARIVARDGAPNNFERADFLAASRRIFLDIDHPSFHRLDGSQLPDDVARDVIARVVTIGSLRITERTPDPDMAKQAIQSVFGDRPIPPESGPIRARA